MPCHRGAVFRKKRTPAERKGDARRRGLITRARAQKTLRSCLPSYPSPHPIWTTNCNKERRARRTTSDNGGSNQPSSPPPTQPHTPLLVPPSRSSQRPLGTSPSSTPLWGSRRSILEQNFRSRSEHPRRGGARPSHAYAERTIHCSEHLLAIAARPHLTEYLESFQAGSSETGEGGSVTDASRTRTQRRCPRSTGGSA